MNDLTIIQSTQGLCAYLIATNPAIHDLGVVIGYDHRANKFGNSKDFARLTAAVFLSKKVKVYWFDTMVHTPLVVSLKSSKEKISIKVLIFFSQQSHSILLSIALYYYIYEGWSWHHDHCIP